MTRLGAFVLGPPEQWLFQSQGVVARAQERARAYFALHRNYKRVECHVEEFVRQWVVRRLLDGYGYPVAWVGQQLVIEDYFQIGSHRVRADIALCDAARWPFLYIETKARGLSKLAYGEAEHQLVSYVSARHTVRYGMVTDGDRVTVIAKLQAPPWFEAISDIPTFSEAVALGLIDADLPIVDTGGDDSKDGDSSRSGDVIIPSAQAYATALQFIAPQISDKQRAMLQAHYRAPKHIMTATEIAHVVGYVSFQPVNTQYGRLGRILGESLEWPSGYGYFNINALASFIHPSESPIKQYHLIMHPELAEALVTIGWV